MPENNKIEFKHEKLSKENFIKLLTAMSKEDMNKLIKEKGKPRKCIKAFIHLD
jgi:predicted RNA-binding protein YlqC (UPF0109 family)